MRINEDIRSPEVRLIDQNNQQAGVVKLADALRMAAEAGFDLVEVAAEAKPPVCKIVDYKKVIYEQKRRQREARKKQKTIDIKEVKMRPSIDAHDYMTKITHAKDFLTDGCKVKVTLFYKGRERTHQDRAKALVDKIQADLAEVAVCDAVNRINNLYNSLIFSKKR
ncbi:translation initiation factor IF-3 [Candidatus Sumerlaeota bacterium]|nr:translation initiation factor IF-3 [Candidatus Sumerlaeota bacterium]